MLESLRGKPMATGTLYKGHQTIEDALELAVAAVNRGQLDVGKAALSWVLRKDPNNTSAWLWMACCLPDDHAKQECYRRVTEISMKN